MSLKALVKAAKRPDPSQEPNLMREALQKIYEDTDFFSSAGGAVSRHDMASMIRSARRRIDNIRLTVWPEEGEG